MKSWRWTGERSRRVARLRAAVWPAVAVLLLVLGAFDYRVGAFGRLGHAFEQADASTAGPLVLICGLLSCVALLLWPRLGVRGLPLVTAGAAALSLATTAAVHVVAGLAHRLDSYSPVQSVVALTEPAALLGLVTLTAWRGAPKAAAGAVPAAMAAVVLRPLAVEIDLGSVVLAFFLTLAATAALAIGLTVRLVVADRRRRESAVRLEQRAEFARDLHDFVAHHVTGIVIQAQGARSVAVRRPDLVPPALERIEHAGAEALKSMRAMVGMLRETDTRESRDPGESRDPREPRERDVALAPLAGMAEVRALVEEFAPVGGARAVLRTEGEFEELPVEVVTTLHRVVMEALTNIRKHARDVTEVEVRLVRSGTRVTVTVSDDGRPRAGHQALPALGGGFGLKGLVERVGMVGGRVEAGPAAGGGWRIEATLPVGGGAEPGRVVGSAA
ncbi:sensor histidine kinase [Streptomyces sp. NBC_00582]|uniref:sensor histidine kinase n=1 Tax=Streptomyces sp. NBC_00582 TaxID=2975783 RepID=UPI002E807FEE|nr:histidine kinase [Streptomyces sp. NBC_00582]WUB63118.1 histidine kinase [Streptomyces sp. NBC_00582]